MTAWALLIAASCPWTSALCSFVPVTSVAYLTTLNGRLFRSKIGL